MVGGEPRPPIRSAIPGSILRATNSSAPEGFGLTKAQMAFAWEYYVSHDADRLHPLAAPLRADLFGLPPVLLVLPEMDVLRSEGGALAAKLEKVGGVGGDRRHSWRLHGFLRACGSVQKARDALATLGVWLQKVR